MQTSQEDLTAFLNTHIKSEKDLNLEHIQSLLQGRKTEQAALDSKVSITLNQLLI